MGKRILPFLRWAGGKQWLVRNLIEIMPRNQYTYYEPFLGGGALFFAAQPKHAILGDINRRLIETYRVVRDKPYDLMKVLAEWPNEKKIYYKVRDEEYSDKIKQAAQFIFLNKSCWNGLYRVNREGLFNVPFGYNGRQTYDEKHIIYASRILKEAELFSCDFQELIREAKSGDFIYFDPPYTVLHSSNGFRRYNENLFSWEDQIRLAETASHLANIGCIVVVSNANNNDVIRLYPKFKPHYIQRHSTLAASSLKRKKTEEVLLISPRWITLNNSLIKKE